MLAASALRELIDVIHGAFIWQYFIRSYIKCCVGVQDDSAVDLARLRTAAA